MKRVNYSAFPFANFLNFSKVFLVLFALTAFSNISNAQVTYTWIGASGGSWALSTNWNPTRTTPALNDVMQFNDGATYTVTAVPTQTIGQLLVAANSNITLQSAGTATLSLNGSTATNNLVVSSGSALTLGGANNLTLNYLTTASQLGDISGTLTVAINNIFNPANVPTTVVTVSSTGTIINSGGTISGSATALIFSAGSNYSHTANGSAVPAAGWNAASTCTVTGVTSTAVTVPSQTYGNFTWQTTGQTATVTISGGTVTFGGALNIVSGTLTVSTATLIANGSTSIGGNLSFTSSTGNKSFADLTINSGGTFNNTAAPAIAISGNLQNDGTFNASTSVYTLSGAAKTISGTTAILAIPSLTVTGTYTNNVTNLTVATALAGAGTLTAGSNTTLTLTGSSAITGLNCTAVPNTVVYNSTTAAQTIKGTIYYNLTISKTGQTGTLGAATTINNNLTITAGTLADGTFLLTGAGAAGTLDMSSVTTSALTLTNTTANPFPAFLNNSFHATASTVNMNATATQNIPALSYGNFSILGSAVKTLQGTTTIQGNLTIGSLSNFTIGPNALTVSGSITNSGTFTGSTTSDLTLDGTVSLTLPTIAGNLRHLTVNKTGGGTVTSPALTVNGNLTVISGTLINSGQLVGTATGLVNIATGATWQIGSTSTAVTFPAAFTAPNITFQSNSTITYGSTANQAVSAIKPYENLSIINASIKTIAASITVNNNLTVGTGATLADGGFQIVGNGSGQLALLGTGALTIGTTNINNTTFPTNFITGNISLPATSTVTYNANAAQDVSLVPSSYGNLTLTSSVAQTKTILSNLAVTGSLTVSGSTTLNIGANNVTVNGGALVTTSTASVTGSGRVILTGGSAAHQINGGGAVASFSNLELNDATQGGSLTGATNISGTLFMTAGTMLLNASTIGINGDISGSGTFSSAIANTGGISIGGTSGGSAGTITMASAPNNVLPNLTVNRTGASSSVTIGAATVIKTSLILTNGTVINSGNLTLGTGTAVTLTTTKVNGSLDAAPSFNLTGVTYNVIYGNGVAVPVINTGTELPATINTLTITNPTNGVNLNAALTCSTGLTLTNGRLFLGNNDLTLTFTTGIGGSPSVSNMVIADAALGTGQLKKVFQAGVTAAYILTVGTTTGTPTYSPVSLNFTANSAIRTIGVIVNASTPPNNGAITNYINRYWTFTDNAGGTYTYTPVFTFAATDVVGTATLTYLNRYNGATWTQYGTPSSATTATQAGLTETTGTIGGNSFSSRQEGSNTYTWNATTGSADYTLATSWTPNRTTLANNDVLLFSNGGASTATNVPTQTIGKIVVSGNTNISLASVAAGQILTFGGMSTGLNLDVQSGSTLQISSTGTSVLTLAFGTGTQTATVAGTFILNPNTGLTNAYNATNAVTTVTGTVTNNGGLFTSTLTNFLIAAGGLYNHSSNQTTLPVFGWNATSTCNVNGFTTATSLAAGSQSFGNFIFNCALSTGSVNAASSLLTINGNFTILNTGAFELRLVSGSSSSIAVAGNLDIQGGTLSLTSALGSPTLTITGNLLLSGTGRFSGNSAATGSTTNLAGNFLQIGGTFDNIGTGVNAFNFTGANKSFTQSAGTFTTTFYNFNINVANASLTLNNGISVSASRLFTVSNGTLITGPNLVTGAGGFTLTSSANATLAIGDAGGITTGTAAVGSIQVTGTRNYGAAANYIYNGTSAQVTGNGLTTCNNLTIDNAAGVTQANAAGTTQNVIVSNQLTLTNGVYNIGGVSGQLNTLTLNGPAILPAASPGLTSSAFSNLVMGSSASAGVYIPSGVTLLNALTCNNTNATGVVLNSSITLNATATALAIGGRIFIGSNDLTIASTTGTISGGSGVTIMVIADGSGQLKKTFGTGATASFNFPIGDANGSFDYSPFAITFSANSAIRTIGMRVTDANHPQLNSNGVQTDYVSRYWNVTDDQVGVGTYTYSAASLTYSTVVPSDVNGTTANYKINRWDGLNWSQLNSTVSAPTVTTSGTYNETSGTLGSNEFTLRVNASQPYIWQPTTGSADFQVASNWSPPRFSPVAADILHFTNGGTSTATNVPTQTVARILVDNNTNVSLQSTTTATFSINGPTGATNLDIKSGSTLQLSSTAAIQLTLNITTTASQIGNIAGTLVLNSNTSNNNTFTTSTVATTVVTVASGGAITNNGGTVTSTAPTLVFANGSSYNHAMNAGAIPIATYNASSTLNITGTTTTNPSGFSGIFGNVTWNCAGQTSASGNISSTMTVNGNLSVLAGTLSDAGVVITGNAAGNFTVGSGATYTTLRTITSWFPTNFISANITLDDNSTFIYAGGTGHTIPNTPVTSYGNLTLTGSVTKTLSAATLVRGSLTINTSNVLADGSFVMTVNKNISNSGSHSGTGRILLTGGTAAHTLTGTGPYGNIELNDVNGANQSGSFTINNTLTLTSGSWSIGSNTLTLNGPFAFTGGDFTGSSTSNLTFASTGGSASLPAITNGLQNLVVSRTTVSTLTLTTNISLAGNLTISASNTVNDGGNILTVAGNSTNNSTTGFTGTGKILFTGGSAVHTLTGTGPYTNFELDDVLGANNAASSGYTINGVLSLTNGTLSIGVNTLTLTGSLTAGGSGFLSGILASSGLVIGGTTGGNYGTLNFAPAGQTLSTFQMNRTGAGGSVNLGTPLTINSTLTLSANGGLIYLGNNDLTLNGGVSGTATVNNMVIADVNNGTGQFKKAFPSGSTSSFTFPVGDVDGTIDYSPFAITMSANSIARTIGIIVNDIAHPQLNSNGVQTDYVTRYWSFTDNQAGVGTYSYNTSTYTYSALSPTDLNGTAANLKVNRWDGLNWVQLVSSVSAPSVSTSGTYNETSGTLGGNDFTLRNNGAQTYVWVPTTGSADWTVATNWSPSRFAPLASDILNFTSGGTSVATNVPAQTVGKILVDNNTDISLQSAAAGIILSVNGITAQTNLDIKAGSTLQISSTGTNQLTLNITTTASQLGNIAGTLVLNSNTSNNNTFASNSVSTTVVTVASGGSITNNGGIVTGSAATLQFAGGSVYNHVMNAGNIPTATYNVLSEVGITSPTAGPTGGVNQTFGAFTLNMGTGSTSITSSSTSITVAGILSLTNGTLLIGTSNTLNLNGTIAAGGSGFLSGIATSTLAVGGVGTGNIGSVAFVGGGQLVGTFTMNRAGATIGLSSPLTVNTTLTLTNGFIDNGANVLTIAATSVGSVSGGSANAYVKGPLERTFPASLVSGTYTFPVGKSAFNLFETITATTNASGTVRVKVEAFDVAAGGTDGPGFNSSPNPAKYWEASVSGAGTLTSPGTIRLTDASMGVMTSNNVIGNSPLLAGTYTSLGGSSPNVPVNTLSTLIAAPTSLGFFKIGTKGTLCGTYTVGAGQQFNKLSDAANVLNNSTVTCDVIFELQSSYDGTTGEVFPITFNNLTYTGGPWNVTVRPASGVTSVTTSGDPGTNTSLISLNGVDQLTLDGVPGGATGGNVIADGKWLIRNTRIVATIGNAIAFNNDATNNTLKYLHVEGQNSSTANGLISFGSTAPLTGNENNTITYCAIHDRSDATGFPLNGIYSSGSGTLNLGNDNITVTNNEIYNYWSASAASNGINVQGGNSGWTITGNSFYQTASRTQTGAAAHSGILISNTSGNNFTVSNNSIGGSAAGATGTPWTVGGAFGNQFAGINMSVGATAASTVQNNIVIDFNWSCTSNSAGLPGIFTGIYVSSGLVNILDNTIGSTTGTGDITVTSGTTGGNTYGIGNTSSNGAITITDNNIGGITVQGTTTSISHNFIGIQYAQGLSTSTRTVTGNTVGSTTTLNSINSVNASISATAQSVTGILMSSGANAANISGNTVANLNNNYAGTGAGTLIGISSPTGINTISGNEVFALTSSSPTLGATSAASVIGISLASATTGTTISLNTIHSLVNTSGAASTVSGIYYSGATTGTNVVEKNFIHSLDATGSSAIVNGIYVNAGIANYSNNMVRLGVDASGNDITNGYEINGIKEGAGTNNHYHNSIYIGGNNVASNLNTYAFQSAVTTGTRAIQNNIFYNARSNASGAGKNYSIKVGAITGLTCNYNDELANGTGGVTGAVGVTDYLTFLNWRSGSGFDFNGFDVDPEFIDPTGTVSTVDLHIEPSPVQTPVEASGTNVVAVTSDFDGQTRSTLSPVDVGADAGNFTAYECAGATSGTASAAPTGPFCGSGSSTISINGYNFGAGISFQWQSSPDGSLGSFADIGGATNTTYATGSISSTTYYRCVTSCSFAASGDTSNAVVLTINTIPSASIDTTGTISICSPVTTYTLNAITNGVTPVYQWQLNGTNISGATNDSYTALASGSYTVIVNDNLCGDTSAATVINFYTSPQGAAVTPPASSLCDGDTISLSGAPLDATRNLISEDFEGAVPGWYYIYTLGTPASARWTVRTSTYSYFNGSTTYNFSSGSKFVMSNADTYMGTTNNQLYTPPVNTTGFTSLNLSFRHHHIAWGSDITVALEVSTNGTTWSTLQNYLGGTQGGQTNFASVNIPLNAVYLNQPTLQFRFNFVTTWGYWWTIDDVVLTGTAPNQFAWTSDTGTPVDGMAASAGTFSLANDTIAVHPTGTTVYTMTVKDPTTSCTSTATSTITVNPAPAIDASSNAPFCSGADTLELFSTAPTATSFSWTGPGGFNSSSANPTINDATTANNGTYTLSITDGNGCSNDTTTSVLIYALPNVGIVPIGTTNICTGQTTTDLQGTGAIDYIWSTTETTSLITVSTGGDYIVTGIDANTCENSDTIVITESAAPIAPIISPTGTIELCTNDGVNFIPVTISCTNYSTDLLWSTSESGQSILVDYADVINVTYTDPNGCFASSNTVMTVLDDIAPVITCPNDTTISSSSGVCGASGAVLTVPATSDNCSVNTVTNDAPAILPVGNTTVIWTVTDFNSNSATCSHVVTVTDDEDPVISNCPVDIDTCGFVATWNAPTASDNCSILSLTSDYTSGSTFPAGTTMVTYTATDVNGNTATCTFNVTVNTAAANADAGPDQTVGTSSAVLDANDPSPGIGTWTVIAGSGTFSPSANDSNATVSGLSAGLNTFRWTISNSPCAPTFDEVDIFFQNCIPPVIGACPTDITQCDNLTASWTDPTSTGTTPVVVCSPLSGSAFTIGTTVVTCTATNSCGTSSCSFNVTINESPVIGACPTDITQCDNHVVTFATPSSTGTPAATVACVPASGSTFVTGTTSVTCTATNSCGSSSCSFNVTINESPVIGACPTDITQCDNHVVTFVTPSSTGTPAATVACVPASGSTFVTGTTSVTCTATNSCGSSSCSFNVTINESPVIGACPTDITQCDNHVVTFATPTSTPAATVTCVPASGSTFVTGTTSVTCTATNSCGSSSCSFSVTINESPVIVCPADISTCNPVVTFAPSATGVPAPTVLCSPASGSTFAIGTTVVTCTATNACGNTTCTFNVNVNTPSTDPVSVTSNAPYNQICLGGNITLTVNGGTLGTGAIWNWYEGGCAAGASIGTGASITITPSAGTHNYFVRAEGACGNSVCVSLSIQVYTALPSGTVHFTSTFIDGCVGAPSNIISVNAVPGAVFYRWTSGQAGVRFNGNPSPFETTVPTVNVTFVSLPASGSSGWSICVFGSNACGNTNNICTWVRATLSAPTSIIGSVIGCPSSTGNPYSVPVIAGAASYQWSSSPGITINGNGSNAITVSFASGFVSGTLTVFGQTSCGYNGASRTITITRAPAIPGIISGPSYPCPNATAAYSVAAVPGAANYTWTTTVPGAIVTGTTNSCTIQFPATIPGGSTVTVVANSSCPFPSGLRSKGIGTGLPGVPLVINGPPAGQCGQTGVSYSIIPVAQATGYNWSTTCGTIVGPNNLSAISIDWPSSFVSCIVTVSATNACGTGGVRNLTVLSAPGIPTSISGNAAPCANSVELYSTPGSQGATSYMWTVPAGASILGPPTGATIIVQWGSTSGNVTVKANNACGNSGIRSLPCTISCRLSQVSNSYGGLNAEVFPNPVIDKTTVRFTSKDAGDVRLSIVDLTGREIFQSDKTCTEGINIVELNLNSVAKGIYLLHLETGGVKEVIRIAVE